MIHLENTFHRTQLKYSKELLASDKGDKIAVSSVESSCC